MRRTLLLLVPITLLLAACGDDSHEGAHGGNTEAETGARSIDVVATSFEFDPPTIQADAGEALEVVLTAEDVEHDFVIDELDAHIGAEAGATATGGFVAEEAGTYTYYCSVPGHREAGMEGELVVG